MRKPVLAVLVTAVVATPIPATASSGMVTADQGGHLAYLFLDNQCANDIATDFLVTGTRPHRDLACQAEPA